MKTRILLLVLFGAACAALALSQPRHEEPAIASVTPSPALLDAMNSHGIATTNEVEAAESPDAPALQPAAYHGAGPD